MITDVNVSGASTEISMNPEYDVTIYLGGIPGPKGDGLSWAIQEVPTGAQNGSNKTFTLAQSPSGTVSVVFNGLEYQSGVDYTATGTTLTLIAFAPNTAEGDRFWVTYPY